MNHEKLTKIFCIAARLIVGGVFVYAAISKIIDPYNFSLQIKAYNIVSERLSRWMAVVLPWMEMITGLLLIIGVWVNVSALLTSGMTVMFIIAIISAMTRGLDIDCGCFGGDSHPVGWSLLLRDIVLLGLSGALFYLTIPSEEKDGAIGSFVDTPEIEKN